MHGSVQLRLQIKNPQGLHMRPAVQFVDTASRFKSDIRVSNGEMEADGKSIMQMSMLAAACGTELHLTAKGADAEQAAEALRELVEVQRFNE